MWGNIGLESRARRLNLAVYDLAYVDLALRKNLPLATSDAALKEAALAEGIQVLL